MMDQRAVTVARRLIRKYRTRDPEEIATNLGVQVKRLYNLKHQKGFFKVIANVCFIFVNGNLSKQMQRMIIAHELGHAVLHKKLCVEAGGIIEFEIFNMTNTAEYEANVFQSILLIDEDELLRYLKEGNDVVFTARAMNVNVNLLVLKLSLMAEENANYHFNLPYIPRRNFLGTVEDDAGSI